jgi:hypothetical protein
VRRYDEGRLYRVDDRLGLLGVDRGAAADRDQQQVDLPERLELGIAQRRLAEVAEVGDAQAAEGEGEEGVRPALRARGVVVLSVLPLERDRFAESGEFAMRGVAQITAPQRAESTLVWLI